MPLHPQSRAWIDSLPAAPPADVATMRAGMQTQSLRFAGPPPDLPGVRDEVVGGVPVRVYPGGDGPRPTVLVLHGGGWVGGDLETHDVTCRRLTLASGWTVVAVDYRRPPEHVFPAALEDVLAVAAGLRAGGDPAVDPGRLAVLGDSAGGTLAAVAARRVRDAGAPPFLLQVLVYPVIDAAMDTVSYADFATGYGLTAVSMAGFWQAYGVTDLDDPDACPARAGDLRGLPPAYVLTAEYDPLRDEGEAYAVALAEAGVSVVARRCLGAIHGFWRLPATFDAGRLAIAEVAAVLREIA